MSARDQQGKRYQDSLVAYPGRDCKPVIQREVLQHEDSTVSPQYDGHGGQSKEEGVDSHHLKSMASRLNGHFGKPFLIEVLHWY